MKQTITIVITGDTEGDLDLAIDEAVDRVKQGYTIGACSNDTGSYRFNVEENQ